MGDDFGIGIGEQAGLGKSLVAIAEYRDAVAAHTEKGREHRQPILMAVLNAICLGRHANILNHGSGSIRQRGK